jgi:hypothetical protein
LKVAGRIEVSLIEDMAEFPKIAVVDRILRRGNRQTHPLADKMSGRPRGVDTPGFV